jgi:hypothetical protein
VADVLMRGVSAEVLRRIDEQAESQGLSRNQFLVNLLNTDFALPVHPVTASDLERASEACADLLDDDLMAQAWR